MRIDIILYIYIFTIYFQRVIVIIFKNTKKPLKSRALGLYQNSVIYGADGGTRTHTLLRAADFESAASAIPPHRRAGIS